MNQLINLKTTTLGVRNPISPAPPERGFLFVALTLAYFALSPMAQAADGDLGSGNTAEGLNALSKVDISSGTAIGNTAVGAGALFENTTGGDNTATGFQALYNNITPGGEFAGDNTADGFQALFSNTTGIFNTATGSSALFFNTTGSGNTADGLLALYSNTTGTENTANGAGALFSNTTGSNNTASGDNALGSNTTGRNNTAEGFEALLSSTGSNNIALGSNAGINLTTGNNNIDIGAGGSTGESNTIRIGTVGVQKSAYIRGISGATVASGVTVIVDTKGRLGTVQSSARFKDDIKPMDKASEAILGLKPMTFRYKKELDPDGIPQFGLVAEQVEKVNPDLVVRDADGKVYTVRYEAVNAMLLNEFLKEHHTVQELEKDLRATIAQQQKQIEALTANLQKVGDQMKLSNPAPQLVVLCTDCP
jgi:hypothetical protein